MADKFANDAPRASTVSPAVNGVAVTPADDTPLTQPSRFLYVGGAGDLAVQLVGDAAPVTLKAVPVGSLLPIRAAYVMATDTTATNIVSLS